MSKRPRGIVEQDDVRYMNASAIARTLGISRPLFYVNIIRLLNPEYLRGRKTKYYKVSEVEQKCHVII